ncbi:hypothetical protein B0O80DRAFT_465342 [Mortierella sp. GBAus27b]|nr:hypothetical protein BGX31_007081 [Mortierella sp. GBA43]KAI8347537.1 hypothetical protein B0O80DRAFT_465342 [Mortierella sp. GBAus27b]
MAHSDKDRAGIAQSTSRLASMAIAMSLPEVLSNILSFVDRSTLVDCLQVSRFWYSCGRPMSWRSYGMTLGDFTDLFIEQHRASTDDKGKKKDDDYGDDSSGSKNMAKHKVDRKTFYDNCRHIRSLTLKDSDALDRPPLKIPDILEAVGPTNLVHLAVDTRNFGGVLHDRKKIQNIYDIVGTILSRNPRIQEFHWGLHCGFGVKFVNAVLKRAGRHLKKLTVKGDLTTTKMKFLKELTNAYKKRLHQGHEQEQRQEQEDKTSEAQALELLSNGPIPDETGSDDKVDASDDDDDSSDDNNTWSYGNNTWSNDNNDASDDNNDNNDASDDDDDISGDWELQELVLRDVVDHGYLLDDKDKPIANLEWLRDVQGILPIRVLIMIDIKIPVPSDGYHTNKHYPKNSILTILSKCPNLEELRVTGEFRCHMDDAVSRKFLNGLVCSIMHLDDSRFDDEDHYEEIEKRGFVTKMYHYCPNLRVIEFGMAYQFTSKHWTEMMDKYGPQLESLSVWGNVHEFRSDAFMSLIGPPISHPSRETQHCLTRLNINGLAHLRGCAWLALKHLPNLKEFRARDVPLDARNLIMEDGWACKGLEVLDIFIAIPRMTEWRWCASTSRWVHDDVQYAATVATERAPENLHVKADEDSDVSDQRSVGTALKRKSGESIMDRPLKRAKVDDRLCPEEKDEKDGEKFEVYHTFHEETQVKICTILGRLTQLRELRIEGEEKFQYASQNWTCLKLTVDTGLDRLAPLRHSLEKLVVSRLDERLYGEKEVDWIARNWIHHNNPRWLKRYSSSTLGPSLSLSSSPLEDDAEERSGNDMTPEEGSDDDAFAPKPRFKELIGLSMPGYYGEQYEKALSNVEWLQEQCPTLSVRLAKQRLCFKSTL